MIKMTSITIGEDAQLKAIWSLLLVTILTYDGNGKVRRSRPFGAVKTAVG